MKEIDSSADVERRMRHLEQQLGTLRELGFTLETTTSLDEVLTDIVHRTSLLMKAERSTLFLVDVDGGLISRYLEGDETQEIRLASGQGLAGWVARHKRPLIVPDVYEDERFDQSWDRKTGYRTRDVVVHPIQGKTGNIIGVLEVLNKKEGEFDEEDLVSLSMLCDQLALTIENSRIRIDLVLKNKNLSESRTQLERQNRRLEIQLELERIFSHVDDIDGLSTVVLERLLTILRCQLGIVYTVDSSGAEMRIVVAGTPGRRVLRSGARGGFSAWVATKGQDLLLHSSAGDPRYDTVLEERIGVPMEDVCAVPLRKSKDDKTIGSILLANRTIGTGLDEHDLSLLRMVARQVTEAMEYMHSRQEKERERRLSTVGRLLAGILHDLKSPITVISGYTELLASKVGDDQSEEYLDHVHRALARISALAGEIIAFSKGERQVLLSTVRLSDFVDYFVKEIKPHLDSNNIELKLHVRTGGTVRIDEEKFFRALFNIVINAIEAMGDHGHLILEVDEIGEEIIFGITDSGPGIPENLQGSIFESFVTYGKDHGTGLGLSVARDIVEDHNGMISFTTSEGKGTTFVVALPSLKNG